MDNLRAVCGSDNENGVERIAKEQRAVDGSWVRYYGRQREAYTPDSEAIEFASPIEALHWVNAVHEDGCECPAAQYATLKN